MTGLLLPGPIPPPIPKLSVIKTAFNLSPGGRPTIGRPRSIALAARLVSTSGGARTKFQRNVFYTSSQAMIAWVLPRPGSTGFDRYPARSGSTVGTDKRVLGEFAFGLLCRWNSIDCTRTRPTEQSASIQGPAAGRNQPRPTATRTIRSGPSGLLSDVYWKRLGGPRALCWNSMWRNLQRYEPIDFTARLNKIGEQKRGSLVEDREAVPASASL